MYHLLTLLIFEGEEAGREKRKAAIERKGLWMNGGAYLLHGVHKNGLKDLFGRTSVLEEGRGDEEMIEGRKNKKSGQGTSSRKRPQG